MNDLDLLLLFEDSPEQALGKIMDLYGGLVYTMVQGKLALGSTWDIEECVSTIFFDFYRNKETIDLNKGSIKTYLVLIAKRRAVDFYRRLSRDQSSPIPPEAACWITADDAGVEKKVARQETKAELLRAISSLGEPDAEIFIRKYYLEQSSKTIAASLKMKVNTVDKRVSRGLKKLRERLGEF